MGAALVLVLVFHAMHLFAVTTKLFTFVIAVFFEIVSHNV